MTAAKGRMHSATDPPRDCADITSGCDDSSNKSREVLSLACQELAQAQYLQALALCAAGRGSEADPWARGLGLRHRLSDAVWAAASAAVHGTRSRDGGVPTGGMECGVNGTAGHEAGVPTGGKKYVGGGLPSLEEPRPAEACRPREAACREAVLVGAAGLGGGGDGSEGDTRAAGGLAAPLVCDGALTAGLHTRLAAAFDPRGPTPYWRQHRYGRRRTPFFSYLYRLDQPPSSVVEEAIQALHARLTNAAQPATGAAETEGTCGKIPDPAAVAGLRSALSGAAVVEWWAHTRDPSAAHQLHFDVNEDVLRKGLGAYRLAHPRLSSVVFLGPGAEPEALPEVQPEAQPEVQPEAQPEVQPEAQPEAQPAAASGAAARGSEVEAEAVGPRSSAASSGASGGGAGPVEGRCRGGPTLVLDQTPQGSVMPQAANTSNGSGAARPCTTPGDRPPLAERAWVVGPWPNRWLVFPGDRLHGVLPEPPHPAKGPSGGFGAPPDPAKASTSAPSGSGGPGLGAGSGAVRAPAAGPAGPTAGPAGPTAGPSGPTASQAGRRTTLILAWWGPERLQTATPAPPLRLEATALWRRAGHRAGKAGGAGGGGRAAALASASGSESEPEPEPELELEAEAESASASGAERSAETSAESEESEEGDGDSDSDGTSGGSESDISSSSSSGSGEPPGAAVGGAPPSPLDWRPAGHLRPGMLPARAAAPAVRQPAAAPATDLSGGHAPAQQDVPAAKRRRMVGPGPGSAAAGDTEAADEAEAAARAGAGASTEVVARAAALIPPTWLDCFAQLQRGQPEADGGPGAGPLEAAGEVRAQQGSWWTPAAVSPAWAPVPQGPSGLLLAEPAIGTSAPSWGEREGREEGRQAEEQAGAGDGGGAGRATSAFVAAEGGRSAEAFELGRQAARGMALALGLSPRQAGVRGAGVDGRVEAAGADGASGLSPAAGESVAGETVAETLAGCLALPELRFFLRSEHDFARLYLPPQQQQSL
ncbi:hypothetical protein HYH03_006967 [Edaphochlamys debaryana]|uniref:Uncharacterized protein n=1 Tax=Edaphochlamys debaryana TaxID=47281 RepID=A0A835Y9W4_9CHLO|nr:hypothetical protein HYH03_006967 [Edaphochlamys debaryana]|eukprot:KAG2495035.1 hypothetical protein HYH03_006967 [Edaphochlamys debaryana]